MQHLSKKTLVIGASENPERYSNLAIKKLLSHGHEVVAIGQRKGNVNGIAIETEKIHFDGIDTVTLYINPTLQSGYYDYILSLHPKRIIFNPGTENDSLSDLATVNGIQPQEACTLVFYCRGFFYQSEVFLQL